MKVGIVVAIGVAALLAGIAVTLAQSAPRQAGDNRVVKTVPVVQLGPRREHCQEGETVPKDAASLQLLVRTNGSPVRGLRVTVESQDGRPVTAGRLREVGDEGYVVIPIRRVRATMPGTTVCIGAGGRGTVLYGEGDIVRLEWLRRDRESWYALIPVVAHRFALGKASLFGSLWALVIALVMAVAAALAIRVMVREVADGP